MRYSVFPYLLLLTVLSAVLSAVSHATQVTLIDQDGNPVNNAVVAFESATPLLPTTEPAVMDQVDKQFSPHVLVVEQEQWVTFPNSDDIRHHVYSFSSPKPFEIKMFKGSDADPVKFDQEGIVVLGCNIHDQMVGYIYVKNDHQAVITNMQGQAQVHPGTTDITIWHARLSANSNERISATLTGDAEQTITLPLMPPPEPKKVRTFGSRKFGHNDE